MDNAPLNLDLVIDGTTLRWYRRLLILRHGSILVGLGTAVVVASPLVSLRAWATGLCLLAGLAFVLTMSLLLWPLSARVLRGVRVTYVRFHHSLNVLTSHALLDEIDPGDGAIVTRQSLRVVVGVEIALVVVFVVVAIVASAAGY